MCHRTFVSQRFEGTAVVVCVIEVDWSTQTVTRLLTNQLKLLLVLPSNLHVALSPLSYFFQQKQIKKSMCARVFPPFIKNHRYCEYMIMFCHRVGGSASSFL